MKQRLLLTVSFVLLFCFSAFAAGTFVYESASISAQNTFTTPLWIDAYKRVNISIDPDTSPIMTITLQRAYNEATSTYHDVKDWDLTAASGDYEYITAHPEAEGVYYRIGCKTGDYTSGNCTVRLGRQY